MVSQTIRNMLTSPVGFAEAEHGEVTFPEISAVILENICQYISWLLPKNTLITFFPKNLLIQFHPVAYLYFLAISALNQLSPLAVFGRTLYLFPLLFHMLFR